MSTSSVVFVGSSFTRQLFDEHGLFTEPMAKDYVAVANTGYFTYGSNSYTFSVVPDRITLNHNSDSVLSDALLDAAGKVVSALEAQSQGHGVTGVGLNFDAVLPQSSGGATGIEFCKGMCNAEQIQSSIGSPFHEVQCQVVVMSGAVRYTLRIEPHLGSRGANLFLSVNGHQDVAATDDLTPKLSKAGSASEYIQSVLNSLSLSFEGKEP